MCGRKLSLRAGGIKPRQYGSARHEAQALQENTLRQGAMRHGASGARSGGKGREIHMGGNIHRTRRDQRINWLTGAHGLQAITEAAFRRPVINQ